MKLYELSNIKKYYDSHCVLDLDYCDFEQGKVYVVCGPNGSGKTTFLQSLAFLLYPEEGVITYKKQIVSCDSPASVKLRRSIGMLTQDPYFFRSTVFDNVVYGLRLRKLNENSITEKVYKVLELVGLVKYVHKKVYKLSGGQKQRVALARVLCLETEVLLLDEPVNSLDSTYRRSVQKIVEEYRGEKTIILTTHDLSFGLKLTDSLYYLVGGKMQDAGLHNIFTAHIRNENGCSIAQVDKKIDISVVSEFQGQVKIAIDPKEIILSQEQVQSSARNSFDGTIVSLTKHGRIVKVIVDIGIDLEVIITQESLEAMGLNIGKKVFTLFKASSVKVWE